MTPYQEGKLARASNDPEPRTPYDVDSVEWRQWVEGWFLEPFSDRGVNYIRQWRKEKGKTAGASEGWERKEKAA